MGGVHHKRVYHIPLCSANTVLTSLDREKFPNTRVASTIASMLSGISNEISTETMTKGNLNIQLNFYINNLLIPCKMNISFLTCEYEKR